MNPDTIQELSPWIGPDGRLFDDADPEGEPGEDSIDDVGKGEFVEDADEDADSGIELSIAALGELPEEFDADQDLEDVDEFLWADESAHDPAPPWSDTIADRDARIAEYDGDAPHGEVREYLRETAVIGTMQEALEDLDTREEETTTPRGEILDMRNVTRRLAGDTTVKDLYQRRVERPAKTISVGVSIDMSGSMSSYELEAKAAVGAFLFAVQEEGGDVVANAWQHENETEVRILTGPQEPFAWRHLDAVSPGGSDPIAQGMHECALMLEDTCADETLLAVLSDGKPTVRSREEDVYDSVLDEAAETAEELRGRGHRVVGFGFGGVNEENLEAMFGDDGYYHVDVEELADALAEEYEDAHPGSPALV